MNTSVCGFTLLEILVASTIFVSLMGVVTFSFHRISNGGNKGIQVLELHTKADAILRFMETDVRNSPNIAALHLRPATSTEPGTFTFMKQVNDTHPYYTHLGKTVPDHNPFEAVSGQSFRLTDLIWVRWQWKDGSFKRGQSRINQRKDDGRQWASGSNDGLKRYSSASMRWIRYADVDRGYPLCIQTNCIPPRYQRHYDYFVGTGPIQPIDPSTGESKAGPGEKIQIYKTVGGAWRYSDGFHLSQLFDWENSPWRIKNQQWQGGDLRHLYTTLECGNQDSLSDTNAYAVRNEDGKSINKDRLNLVGAKDVDDNGNILYPSQIYELFDCMEYVKIELVKRNGAVLTESDDTNRLNDPYSLDISGVDPLSGEGLDKRPTHVRISYLLHNVTIKNFDELDIDGDGDGEEPLSQAIREVVERETGLNRIEKIAQYKALALQRGYTAIFFSQTVLLGN